jgi:hypothetical protein
VLNDILPFAFEESEYSLSLDKKQRIGAAIPLCIALLEQLVSNTKFIIVINDGHLLSNDAWELVAQIHARVDNILVCIAMCPNNRLVGKRFYKYFLSQVVRLLFVTFICVLCTRVFTTFSSASQCVPTIAW